MSGCGILAGKVSDRVFPRGYYSVLGRLGQRLQRLFVALTGRIRVRAGRLTARFRVSNHREWRHLAGIHFEREQIEAFLALLRADDVVYEVGGHIGSWTAFLGQRVESGHVHVFEPELNCRGRLVTNVRLNRLDNVTVHPFAASDRSGTAAFGVVDRFADGRHSLEIRPDHARVTSVATLALDDAPDRLGIARPTALKLDVEGSEARVIAGARSLLAGVRLVFAEIHGAAEGAGLRETMARAGFEPRHQWTRGSEEHVLFVR